jgi:hypothetical protein
MTPEDMRQHSRAWIKAAMKLEEFARQQTVEVNGKLVAPTAICAAADLARAVSNSYAEIAGE